MPKITRIGVKYRGSWLVKNFEEVILPYLRPGDSVLFIPAGRYRLPRSLIPVECYYLDIDANVLNDVPDGHRFIMDMLKAGEELDRTFDVVVSDPPYHIPYNQRFRFVKVLAGLAERVIIVKWNLIPRFGSNWELEELYIYEGRRWWTYASIITVWTRRR